MNYKNLEIKEVRYSLSMDRSVGLFIFARDTITGEYNVYFGSIYRDVKVPEEPIDWDKFEEEEQRDVETVIKFGAKLPWEHLRNTLDLVIKRDKENEMEKINEKYAIYVK